MRLKCSNKRCISLAIWALFIMNKCITVTFDMKFLWEFDCKQMERKLCQYIEIYLYKQHYL